MLHEIAHALLPSPEAGENGHHEAWVEKAREIGCTFAHVLPYALANRHERLVAEGKLHTAVFGYPWVDCPKDAKGKCQHGKKTEGD
jgi:hypothetical protein